MTIHTGLHFERGLNLSIAIRRFPLNFLDERWPIQWAPEAGNLHEMEYFPVYECVYIHIYF